MSTRYRLHLSGGCDAFLCRAMALVTEHHIMHVVLAAAWEHYTDDRAVTGVDQTIKALHDLGVETTLIGQSPFYYIEPVLIQECVSPAASDFLTTPDVRAVVADAQLREIAARQGVAFIDPIASMCRDGVCRRDTAAASIFIDYGHFSAAGSRAAVRASFLYLRRPS